MKNFLSGGETLLLCLLVLGIPGCFLISGTFTPVSVTAESPAWMAGAQELVPFAAVFLFLELLAESRMRSRVARVETISVSKEQLSPLLLAVAPLCHRESSK